MINQTTDYSIFKTRSDNRMGGLSEPHVRNVIKSIERNNLLHLNPICVNSNMEVIGGQHRLEAARRLNVPIYYIIDDNLKPEDMLLMGVGKGWTLADCLNFYVKQGVQSYVQMQDFMKKHNLSVSSACSIVFGYRKSDQTEFKEGKFKFECKYSNEVVDRCKQILDLLDPVTASSFKTNTRTLIGLIKVVSLDGYEHDRMFAQVNKYLYRITNKASMKEIQKMFLDIYNTGKHTKLGVSDNDT